MKHRAGGLGDGPRGVQGQSKSCMRPHGRKIMGWFNLRGGADLRHTADLSM